MPTTDTVFDVECPPFDIELSHWDRICPPTHSKRLLCFSTVPGVEREQVVDCLRHAFTQTVHDHPFLGGSILPFVYGRPWLRDIAPRGAARLRIRDLSTRLSFSELARANFPARLLKAEDLCTFTQVAYVTEDPVDVCAFTATFIDGGMILAVEIFHVAADALGVTEIIKTFASYVKLAQAQGPISFPGQRTPIYRQIRPQIVHSAGVKGSAQKHPAYGSSSTNAFSLIQNTSNSAKSFRIGAKSLVALKEYVSAGLGPGEWISTADAISALIWRAIVLGRRRAGHFTEKVSSPGGADDTTFLSQAVDFRHQLRLPRTYLGNAVYMTKVGVPTSELIADGTRGLATAAKTIRGDVNTVTADRVHDFLGYIEDAALHSHTCVNIFQELTSSGVILTNHFKFDLHAIDFGPGAFTGGKIQALRFPERGIMRGAIIVMPKLADGGCEFLLTEQDDTLAEMAKDEVFCRFVQE